MIRLVICHQADFELKFPLMDLLRIVSCTCIMYCVRNAGMEIATSLTLSSSWMFNVI